eukprot:1139113-Pelagomonas_calceolata.AAC.7
MRLGVWKKTLWVCADFISRKLVVKGLHITKNHTIGAVNDMGGRFSHENGEGGLGKSGTGPLTEFFQAIAPSLENASQGARLLEACKN